MKIIRKMLEFIDLRDVFVFGGLAIAVKGVAGFSEPAAWILCGAVIFVLGIKR